MQINSYDFIKLLREGVLNLPYKTRNDKYIKLCAIKMCIEMEIAIEDIIKAKSGARWQKLLEEKK